MWKMKSLIAVAGALLLIAGIAVQGLYAAGTRLMISGVTISRNTTLVSGIALIFVGLLFIFVAMRIPKLQPVRE